MLRMTVDTVLEGVLVSEPMATLGRVRGRGPLTESVGGVGEADGSDINTPSKTT